MGTRTRVDVVSMTLVGKLEEGEHSKGSFSLVPRRTPSTRVHPGLICFVHLRRHLSLRTSPVTPRRVEMGSPNSGGKGSKVPTTDDYRGPTLGGVLNGKRRISSTGRAPVRTRRGPGDVEGRPWCADMFFQTRGIRVKPCCDSLVGLRSRWTPLSVSGATLA